MKKLILMVTLLALFVGFAYAEPLDYSGMSDDELIAVYQGALAEIQSRGLVIGEERTLREGKYIIGKDIPAGSYIITCIQTEGEAVGDAYGALGSMIDASDDELSGFGDAFGAFGNLVGDYSDTTVEILGDYGDVLRSYSMKTGDHFTIELEEGTALQISDGSCTIVSE